jgi:CRP/FNR family cyclic AMP-dependent transcriptional regulator
VLLHLPLHAIDEIVARDPHAWRLFGLITIAHLDLAIGGSDDLMIRDHVARFVAVLLRVGNRRSGSRDGTDPVNEPVEIDVRHDELAHMANVARTTAGSILRSLAEQGLIALSYRRITILNAAALRAMLTTARD